MHLYGFYTKVLLIHFAFLQNDLLVPLAYLQRGFLHLDRVFPIHGFLLRTIRDGDFVFFCNNVFSIFLCLLDFDRFSLVSISFFIDIILLAYFKASPYASLFFQESIRAFCKFFCNLIISIGETFSTQPNHKINLAKLVFVG